MDIYQAFISAIVQGVSEFLPISSSAHLILLPKIMHLPDQGLAFDVVLHLGTLTAIILYYKKSISTIIYAFFTKNPNNNIDAKLGWGVILGTIPVGVAGLIFKDYIEINLRSIEIIAYSTLIFGLLLGLADFLHKNKPTLKNDINWVDILIIGSFQALALIPGTSRSGITITAGLLLGLSYKFATKFAFLLSIPVIVLSSGLIIIDLFKYPEKIDWLVLSIGFVVSAIVAYITVFFFIRLIEKLGMMPFVVYRVILAISLFWIV